MVSMTGVAALTRDEGGRIMSRLLSGLAGITFCLGAAAFSGVAAASGSAGLSVPVVSAKLSGAGMMPKSSSPGSGNAKVNLDVKTGKVCWTLAVRGTDRPRSADINLARGPLLGRSVVPLGGSFVKSGCVISPTKIVKQIISNPAGYYVSVRTKKYPQGALGGRLHR
jgi:hypothetical protein